MLSCAAPHRAAGVRMHPCRPNKNTRGKLSKCFHFSESVNLACERNVKCLFSINRFFAATLQPNVKVGIK
jgi:hypothetical protein